MSAVPVIETARLVLRGYRESDAGPLHAAFGDPVAMRHWDSGPNATAEDTARALRFALQVAPEMACVWTITRRADGEILGLINYHHRSVRHRRLELGWMMVPGHARQGVMGEAARGVIRHCVGALGVHRIEAMIEPENTASRRLAARLGFVCEAELLRDRGVVDGAFRSVMLYALLAPEFLAA